MTVTVRRTASGGLVIETIPPGGLSDELAMEVGRALMEMAERGGAKPDQRVWKAVHFGPRHNA